MGSWTGSECLALAVAIGLNVLLTWGLARMLASIRQANVSAETAASVQVVFLPRRHASPSAGDVSGPRPTPARVRSSTVPDQTSRIAAGAIANPRTSGVDEASSSSADLDLRVPEVTLLPARKPWERAPVLDPSPTRFAKYWREPRSIGAMVPGGAIKDPSQLCAEGERMMQKRGCAPMYNNSMHPDDEGYQ